MFQIDYSNTRALFKANAQQSAQALSAIAKQRQRDDDAGAYEVLQRLLKRCRNPSSKLRRVVNDDEDSPTNDATSEHDENNGDIKTENGYEPSETMSEYDGGVVSMQTTTRSIEKLAAHAAAGNQLMDDASLFRCKVEISGRARFYKLKVLPCLEPVPTMYAWAPIQKNIYVSRIHLFFAVIA